MSEMFFETEFDHDTPMEGNSLTWYDSETGNPWIKFNGLVMLWNNNNTKTQFAATPQWIQVANRGPRYINHVIKQVGGLLTQRRVAWQRAEYVLNALYAMLESKL